jgi:prolipoprotein diacylglyceryl transferase
VSVLAAIPPPPFDPVMEIGPLTVAWYGVVIAVGAFLGLRLTVSRYEQTGGDPDLAEKAALMALLFGFLGARIGYVVPRFLGDGGFVERPQDILAIWQGGLAFFGGLVGGTLAVIIYLRAKGVTVGGYAAFADAVAPGLPLAQAFGRWGNYFNQELFGRPTDLPWALRVDPEPAARAGFPDATTFHPTFLYESLWNLALVGVILTVDRLGWLKRRGSLFFVYLIGYGIGRGWIEALRVDVPERYFGLSRNNWIAIAVALIGIAGLRYWEARGTAPLRDAPDADDPDAPDTDTGNSGSQDVDTEGSVDPHAHTPDADATDAEAPDTDGAGVESNDTDDGTGR